MSPGTVFYPFAKPGKVKEGMTAWEVKRQKKKTERARRWIHACGRFDFTDVAQITKHTYICSLHFIEPIEENPDPIIATSLTGRTTMPRKRPRERNNLPLIYAADNYEDPVEVEVLNDSVSTNIVGDDKSTQTVSVEKAILAAQIETRVLKNDFLLREKPIRQEAQNSMSFNVIYADREKCKFLLDFAQSNLIYFMNF